MISREWRSVTTAFIFTIILLFTACGGPAVKHSSIDGEVKNIRLWSIELVDSQSAGESKSSIIIDMKQKAMAEARQKHAVRYIKELENQLENKGYRFPGTEQARAVIRIKLDWQEPRQYITGKKGAEKYDEPALDRPADKRITTDSLEIDSDYLISKLSPGLKINHVEIELLDYNGRSLGKITIGENPYDKINTEYTADVINKIISRGKY